MTREATSVVGLEVVKPVIRTVHFVELDYPSGFVRVNSSDRNISFDSGSGVVSFTGIGQLGSISSVGETASLQASSVSLVLNGIPLSTISAAFEKSQGRPGKIWMGFLDSNYALLADPALYFVGLIDNSVVDLGDTGTVSVTLNNRFILWGRNRVRRYTNEDQQAKYPGDLFFQFVQQAVEKEIIWGPGGPEPVVAGPPGPPKGALGETSPGGGISNPLPDRGETSLGGESSSGGPEGGPNSGPGQSSGGQGGVGDTGSGGTV